MGSRLNLPRRIVVVLEKGQNRARAAGTKAVGWIADYQSAVSLKMNDIVGCDGSANLL